MYACMYFMLNEWVEPAQNSCDGEDISAPNKQLQPA